MQISWPWFFWALLHIHVPGSEERDFLSPVAIDLLARENFANVLDRSRNLFPLAADHNDSIKWFSECLRMKVFDPANQATF